MHDRLIRNARILLNASCRARAGDTLLILAATDALAQRTPALVAAATELGLAPVVLDIRAFVASRSYAEGRVLEPIRAAMMSADIVIANIEHLHNAARPDFSRLLGNPDAHNHSLTGERRWVYLTCNGMEQWDISEEAVQRMIERTQWLVQTLSLGERRAYHDGHGY